MFELLLEVHSSANKFKLKKLKYNNEEHVWFVKINEFEYKILCSIWQTNRSFESLNYRDSDKQNEGGYVSIQFIWNLFLFFKCIFLFFFFFRICFILFHVIGIIRSDCCWRTTVRFNKTGDHLCEEFENAFLLNPPNQCQVDVCGDGLRHRGRYCGQGSCNIIGCNCEGGCIPGDAITVFQNNHGDKIIGVHEKQFLH